MLQVVALLVFNPVAAFIAIWAFQLDEIRVALMPLKVIGIPSSVPVGFIALVPPSLYKLDVDLANSAWLITTALLAVVIPLQMLVVSWI